MKTTKSKKTQYRGEIPMLEFIAANPDMTAAEIASALNRGMPSVSGQIRQLRGMHRIIPGGLRNGATVSGKRADAGNGRQLLGVVE